MKYSLRSLFIFITLVAIVLGGRSEYQRQTALWHQKEANRCLKNLQVNLELTSEHAVELAESATNHYSLLLAFPKPDQQIVLIEELVPAIPSDDTCGFIMHRRLAEAFRTAWPWTLVSEKPDRGGEFSSFCEVP